MITLIFKYKTKLMISMIRKYNNTINCGRYSDHSLNKVITICILKPISLSYPLSNIYFFFEFIFYHFLWMLFNTSLSLLFCFIHHHLSAFAHEINLPFPKIQYLSEFSPFFNKLNEITSPICQVTLCFHALLSGNQLRPQSSSFHQSNR